MGGACLVAPGGHAWLLGGGMCGCSRGACMVALGEGACVVAPGEHAWLLWGGHAWLLPGEACVVALGGMRGCSGRACVVALGGHAWLLPGGEVCVGYGDTVNERAVRILLECILVFKFICFFAGVSVERRHVYN